MKMHNDFSNLVATLGRRFDLSVDVASPGIEGARVRVIILTSGELLLLATAAERLERLLSVEPDPITREPESLPEPVPVCAEDAHDWQPAGGGFKRDVWRCSICGSHFDGLPPSLISKGELRAERRAELHDAENGVRPRTPAMQALYDQTADRQERVKLERYQARKAEQEARRARAKTAKTADK